MPTPMSGPRRWNAPDTNPSSPTFGKNVPWTMADRMADPVASPNPWQIKAAEDQIRYQQWKNSVDSINHAVTMHGHTMRGLEMQNRAMAQSGLQQIGRQFLAQVVSDLISVQLFVENLQKVMKNRTTSMQYKMESLALRAQQDTIAEYQRTRSGLDSYRQNDDGKWKRYSGGLMLRALEGQDWYKVHPDGITWIIPGAFDQKAKQWYRLNFGAAPKNTPGVKVQYTMSFFGQGLGKGPNLDNAPRSSPFSIPAGVWGNKAFPQTPEFGKVKGTGTGPKENMAGRYFYPLGAMKDGKDHTIDAAGRRASAGIVGARFLDVGLQTINRGLPVVLEELVREMVEESHLRSLSGGKSGRGSLQKLAGRDLDLTRDIEALNRKAKNQNDTWRRELGDEMRMHSEKATADMLRLRKEIDRLHQGAPLHYRRTGY